MTFWASSRATVYVRDPTTKQFTVVSQSNIKCRLTRVATGTATGTARAELAQLRSFVWDPSVVIPERGVQIEVNGERWNPVVGTFGLASLPAQHRRCDVIGVRPS
jgi:hypothetical protein